MDSSVVEPCLGQLVDHWRSYCSLYVRCTLWEGEGRGHDVIQVWNRANEITAEVSHLFCLCWICNEIAMMSLYVLKFLSLLFSLILYCEDYLGSLLNPWSWCELDIICMHLSLKLWKYLLHDLFHILPKGLRATPNFSQIFVITNSLFISGLDRYGGHALKRDSLHLRPARRSDRGEASSPWQRAPYLLCLMMESP